MRLKNSILSVLVLVHSVLPACGQSTEPQVSGPSTEPPAAGRSTEPPSSEMEAEAAENEDGAKSAVVPPYLHKRPQDHDLTNPGRLFDRLYSQGVKSYEIRALSDAEDKLLDAIKEAKNLGGGKELIKSRIALGDVYSAWERFKPAEELYSACSDSSRRAFGPQSKEYAHVLYGLANVNFHRGRFAKAEDLARQSVAIQKKLYGDRSHDTGMSLVLLGRVLGARGWTEEAHYALQQGLEGLELQPGVKSLDYADALRGAGLFYHAFGKRNRAREYFEHSYSIKDKAVVFDQPTRLAGNIQFKWEDGSPRAQEFSDADFPLKYMVTNSVRVSATIVDLWELMGVLISITNIGDKKVELGLGKAQVTELEEPRKPLLLIEDNTIDVRRRERTMWDLTYNRPWLANIQKTRTFRGFVPPRGHDLFRGPNIFGIYGKWGGTPRILPPEKFMLQRSPEQLEEQAQAVIEEDLVRSRNQAALGLVPVTLEPFESRTGVLYYLNPRKEFVLVTVPVGNAVFQFPFKLTVKRIPH